MLAHGIQGFPAHVVLDPFGVGLRAFAGDPDGEEKTQDQLVTLAAGFGDRAAFGSQLNGAAWAGGEDLLLLEALERAHDRDMRDPKMPRQVHHAGLPLSPDQIINGLCVVLGDLGRVLLANALVTLRRSFRFFLRHRLMKGFPVLRGKPKIVVIQSNASRRPLRQASAREGRSASISSPMRKRGSAVV